MTSRAEDQADEAHTLELGAVAEIGPWRVEVGTSEGTSSLVLEPGKPVTLGARAPADLCVSDSAVSALHCRLFADAGGVEVTDLGSKNGLYVGGARVRGARLVRMPASFVIGRTTVTLLSSRTGPSGRAASTLPGLVGSSEAMRRVAEEVRRHASTRAPILIQGESGTGKDLVARAIHQLGRGSGPYVPLNVGAINETLADSELFGHRRGAFTGAVAHRQGAFELAHRGTLFLDEVAELSPAVQVKLLRVVEDGMVRPIGAHHAVSVDVRIVSASWAGLKTRVEEGRFRADLYHRLSTVTLRLPPLRERRGDIPALATALLSRLRAEVGTKELSSAALAVLVDYDWPGNVRELASVLYRAAVSAPGTLIDGAHVALGSAGERATRRVRDCAELDPFALLARHEGNVSAAARAAHLPRTTFRSLLLKRGLQQGSSKLP